MMKLSQRILFLLLPLFFCNCAPQRSFAPDPEPAASHVASLAVSGEGSVVNGPEYLPPFEVRQGERVDAELRVSTFLDATRNRQPAESATLAFGNKRVAVRESAQMKMETGRENAVTLLVNDNPILRFTLVANYQGKGGETGQMIGPRMGDRVSLETDAEAGVIRMSFLYALPGGKERAFTYSLESLGESRMKLGWDLGCTAGEIAAYREQGHEIGGSIFYLDVLGDYRADGMRINGVKLEPKSLDELKRHEKEKQEIWRGNLEEMVYAPAKPLHGFTLRGDGGLAGVCTEVFQYNRVDLGFRFTSDRPQNSVEIDFGEVAAADKDAPPAIEGHDLWVQDALHLPKSPTRNLFPNASFEQGLLYWRW